MTDTPSTPQSETPLDLYFKAVERLHNMKLEQIRELGSTFVSFGSTATDALSKGIQGINESFAKQLEHIAVLFLKGEELSNAKVKVLAGKDELFARDIYDDDESKK